MLSFALGRHFCFKRHGDLAHSEATRNLRVRLCVQTTEDAQGQNAQQGTSVLEFSFANNFCTTNLTHSFAGVDGLVHCLAGGEGH